MDYAVPERRKNRNDKRAKARFNRFKVGGTHRTQNVSMNHDKQEKKDKL